MSIKVRQFNFQNSNGRVYTVQVNTRDWTGFAEVTTSGQGLESLATPQINTTRVALTVDAGARAAFPDRLDSFLAHAAIWNTGQTLNAVLNAA